MVGALRTWSRALEADERKRTDKSAIVQVSADMYFGALYRCSLALTAAPTREELQASAREDWERDKSGTTSECERDSISFERFKDAMFQLADMYTSSMEPDEYVDFLTVLLTHVCDEHGAFLDFEAIVRGSARPEGFPEEQALIDARLEAEAREALERERARQAELERIERERQMRQMREANERREAAMLLQRQMRARKLEQQNAEKRAREAAKEAAKRAREEAQVAELEASIARRVASAEARRRKYEEEAMARRRAADDKRAAKAARVAAEMQAGQIFTAAAAEPRLRIGALGLLPRAALISPFTGSLTSARIESGGMEEAEDWLGEGAAAEARGWVRSPSPLAVDVLSGLYSPRRHHTQYYHHHPSVLPTAAHTEDSSTVAASVGCAACAHHSTPSVEASGLLSPGQLPPRARARGEPNIGHPTSAAEGGGSGGGGGGGGGGGHTADEWEAARSYEQARLRHELAVAGVLPAHARAVLQRASTPSFGASRASTPGVVHGTEGYGGSRGGSRGGPGPWGARALWEGAAHGGEASWDEARPSSQLLHRRASTPHQAQERACTSPPSPRSCRQPHGQPPLPTPSSPPLLLEDTSPRGGSRAFAMSDLLSTSPPRLSPRLSPRGTVARTAITPSKAISPLLLPESRPFSPPAWWEGLAAGVLPTPPSTPFRYPAAVGGADAFHAAKAGSVVADLHPVSARPHAIDYSVSSGSTSTHVHHPAAPPATARGRGQVAARPSTVPAVGVAKSPASSTPHYTTSHTISHSPATSSLPPRAAAVTAASASPFRASDSSPRPSPDLAVSASGLSSRSSVRHLSRAGSSQGRALAPSGSRSSLASSTTGASHGASTSVAVWRLKCSESGTKGHGGSFVSRLWLPSDSSRMAAEAARA